MNHNEILGWEGALKLGVKRWVTLLLEDGTESDRMKLRAKVTLELVAKAGAAHRVKATGTTLLAKMLTLALLGDFVSLYLAALNEEDPYTINSIEQIKRNYLKSGKREEGRGKREEGRGKRRSASLFPLPFSRS